MRKEYFAFAAAVIALAGFALWSGRRDKIPDEFTREYGEEEHVASTEAQIFESDSETSGMLSVEEYESRMYELYGEDWKTLVYESLHAGSESTSEETTEPQDEEEGGDYSGDRLIVDEDAMIGAVTRYVCGLDFSNFGNVMSDELPELDGAAHPYIELNGVVRFSDTEYLDGDNVRFKADGVVYTFHLTYDEDGKINSIVYVEEV